MKIKIVLLVFICFLFYSAISQENKLILTEEFCYHSEADKLIPTWKITFKYDDFNNLILRENFEWDKLENRYDKRAEIEKIYNGTDITRETSQQYFEEAELIQNSTVDYSYFKSGCIDSIFTINYQVVDTTYMESKFYNEISCLLDSIIIYDLGFEGNFRKADKTIYEYTEMRTIRRYFFRSSGDWQETGRTELNTDERDNIVWLWTNATDFGIEAARVYEYDEFDNITLERYFRKQSASDSLKMVYECKWDNKYNSNGLLIEKRNTCKDFNYWTGEIEYEGLENIELYDYYCDGLLKQEQLYWGGKLREEKKYYYQRGVECDEEEQISLKIYPNPIAKELNLISELLLNENSVIRVYDVGGRLVFMEKVKNRVDQYKIELENLQRGVYILELEGGKKRIREKFMKV
jgi:hypothetical protein